MIYFHARKKIHICIDSSSYSYMTVMNTSMMNNYFFSLSTLSPILCWYTTEVTIHFTLCFQTCTNRKCSQRDRESGARRTFRRWLYLWADYTQQMFAAFKRSAYSFCSDHHKGVRNVAQIVIQHGWQLLFSRTLLRRWGCETLTISGRSEMNIWLKNTST